MACSNEVLPIELRVQAAGGLNGLLLALGGTSGC